MSSVPRSSRSIDSNVQFFVAVGNVNGITVADLNDDIAGAGDGEILGNLGSVLNTNGFSVTTTQLASSGDLLRDMGKTLYVQDNGKNIEIYKLVQAVNANFEDAFYALVWQAAGTTSAVTLVRTGF